VIGPQGPLKKLTTSHVNVLRVLIDMKLRGDDTWLDREAIAMKANVSYTSVGNCINALRNELGAKSISNKNSFGYRLELAVSRLAGNKYYLLTESTFPELAQRLKRIKGELITD